MTDRIIKPVGEVGPVKLYSLPSGATIIAMVKGRVYDDRGHNLLDGASVNARGILSNDTAVKLGRMLIATAKANGYEAPDAG
jgi:hypothetical protein